MSNECMYRVVTTRKKTKGNPNYRYWDASTEPRYFITDDEEVNYSKPYKAKGTAKAERSRTSAYSPETLISTVIQKAEMVWQTLTEDEI